MLGWILFGLLLAGGMALMVIVQNRWGRGVHSEMTVNMESESASYTNYLRGPKL